MPVRGETVGRFDNVPMISVYVHGRAAVRFIVDTGFSEALRISPLFAYDAGREISEDRVRIKVRRGEETSRITLGSCKIDIDWFGTRQEVIATIGRTAYGRLGVALLHDCILEVNWPQTSVLIDRPGSAAVPAANPAPAQTTR